MLRLFLIPCVFLFACDDGTDAPPDPVMDAAPADTAVADMASPDAMPDPMVDSGVDAAGPPPFEPGCRIEGDPPESVGQLGCQADFDALASAPLDSAIPGARSLKTLIDRVDGDQLHFIDSNQFGIHWDFASAMLSGRGLPLVPMLAGFNATEYSAPSRRFLLGSLTFYEGPQVWVYEIAPYDSAGPEMIESAWRAIAQNTWIGGELFFHPTSDAVARSAAALPADVPVIQTDALFEGIDYQPLNFAEAYGRLRFVSTDALEETYLSFRDIVVLESVPNDISVVSGIITAAFQTPLSHINVLSKNRGTPNMALRNAFDDPALRALDGQWVRLNVASTEYTIEAVDVAEADAWWDANKPAEVGIPGADLSVQTLVDLDDALDPELDVHGAIGALTRAVGGKAAHYAVLRQIDDLPVPRGFAVPIHFYFDFMAQHGFDAQVDALLADPAFLEDPAVRDNRLAELRDQMRAAPLDPALERALLVKLRGEFPGTRMRFRSSTNAEDLEGFTGAGLYTSKSADPDDPERPIADAVRAVWASVWFFRAFEERSYRSIDHRAVGMALLVHRSFPDEAANGVALTANPFDPSGLEPAFFINVQRGETSVVQPPPGVLTESLLYFFDRPDQPATYLSRSTLVPEGETVLSAAQLFELGQALDSLRRFFSPIYGARAEGFWAMDVEFKFDGDPPALFIKQARPFQ
jgi:hypothetical protein